MCCGLFGVFGQFRMYEITCGLCGCPEPCLCSLWCRTEHFGILACVKPMRTELKGPVWYRTPEQDTQIIAIGFYLWKAMVYHYLANKGNVRSAINMLISSWGFFDRYWSRIWGFSSHLFNSRLYKENLPCCNILSFFSHCKPNSHFCCFFVNFIAFF